MIVSQILGHKGERALKELSNELYWGAESLLVPGLCADLKKIVENGKI